MLFFHLPYRKLTSNIENSNHSFEEQKSPPVIFPPLILLPIPTPYSIQILSSKIKKTVNFKKTKKPLLKGGYNNKTRNQIRIPDLKKSKLFFIQYIFFGSRMRKLLFSPFSVDIVSVHIYKKKSIPTSICVRSLSYIYHYYHTQLHTYYCIQTTRSNNQ